MGKKQRPAPPPAPQPTEKRRAPGSGIPRNIQDSVPPAVTVTDNPSAAASSEAEEIVS